MPSVFVTSGMPGVPGLPGESVFGTSSLVHVLPPPVSGTRCSCGRSRGTPIPFSSLFMTVVFVEARVLGATPPPHFFVDLRLRTFWLIFSDAGPGAASRRLPLRKRLPFLTLIVPSTRRNLLRSPTAEHGFLLTTRRACLA